jgi:hypothetical protein
MYERPYLARKDCSNPNPPSQKKVPDPLVPGSIKQGTVLISVADPGFYPGSEFFPSRTRMKEFKYGITTQKYGF